MKLLLREYNVTPIKEKRDSVTVQLEGDKVLYNDRVIEDKTKIDAFVSFINENKEAIVKLNEQHISNYKGGRQKAINIIFDGDEKVYNITGNTNVVESAGLYSLIKAKLGEVIKE